jgi:alkyl hydroperoxide reductase subunit AhpC
LVGTAECYRTPARVGRAKAPNVGPDERNGRRTQPATWKKFSMLAVKARFPDFELTGCVSRNPKAAFGNFTHASYPDKWVVYFFWPKDFTPVCATELIAFGHMTRNFAERDAVLLGGSVDSEFVHLAWCRAIDHPTDDVPFPLLADVRRRLCSDLGILDEFEGVALRATFIVDPGQTIRHVSVNDFFVGRNPQECLRILDGLQTDALCPARWERGQQTIDRATSFIEKMPVLG